MTQTTDITTIRKRAVNGLRKNLAIDARIKNPLTLVEEPATPAVKGGARTTRTTDNDGKEKTTCDWVAENPLERCSLNNFEPFYACPAACDPKCGDI